MSIVQAIKEYRAEGYNEDAFWRWAWPSKTWEHRYWLELAAWLSPHSLLGIDIIANTDRIHNPRRFDYTSQHGVSFSLLGLTLLLVRTGCWEEPLAASDEEKEKE